MLGNFHASLLAITFLLTIAVQENVPAQVPHFSDAFLFDVRITQSGKPVAVRIADPFARLDQERALLKFLNEPHTYGWDGRDQRSHLAGDVNARHDALESPSVT
jgi:hypothetical protein